MKTFYECEICSKQNRNRAETLKCENQPVPKPNFEVNETVYLKERYPDDPEKPFVERKILAFWIEAHQVYYELDEYVQVGKSLLAGFGYNSFDEDGIGATEYYMFRLGSLITLDYINEIPLTLEMVV